MRVYFTTDVARTETIFQEGFTDLYQDGGIEGVWLADRQLDINDGYSGDVTLCLDVSDDVFKQYEWVEDGGGPGYRYALVPAAVINTLGPPQVYDHFYAGCSRRGLIQAKKSCDKGGSQTRGHAVDIRNAIEFLDRIGWLTPLKLREGEAVE